MADMKKKNWSNSLRVLFNVKDLDERADYVDPYGTHMDQ